MSKEAQIERSLPVLRCTGCRTGSLTLVKSDSETNLKCSGCGSLYPVKDNAFFMLPEQDLSGTKRKIQEFWGDLCKQWYTEFDKSLTPEILDDYLQDLEKMFRYRQHLAVTEMPLENLKGMNVLEIGSGGGAHSALFKKHGANVISMDITPERVASTSLKLALVREGSGMAVQGDAESLPFADSSFDIVYSNGVLHHSEDTEKCIQEVYRVLKPHGKAIIMLYSRHSALYWLNLLPTSILTGLIFKFSEAERIGIMTEGRPKFGITKNPITRIYSAEEMRSLFKAFKIESLRKNSFQFSQIFLVGYVYPRIKRLLDRKPWKSGMIVYGSPYYAESRLERWLGQYFGFGWNIVASKD